MRYSDLPELLTIYEVSELIGVHYNTVYRWILIDKIPAIHIKGTKYYRIKKQDILSILEV